MNYLAHLYIAEATETSHAGALLGDHVRGRLDGKLGPGVEAGIHLHRRVDTFTDSHPLVLDSFRCLAPPFRRYAGILVDIYFDYLLARTWSARHALPLDRFVEVATTRVREQWPIDAPFPVQRLDPLPVLLNSYRHPAGIVDALKRVDQRLSRPSPLPHAWEYLQARDNELATAFEAFFPELLAFARTEAGRGSMGNPPASDEFAST